MNHTVQREAVLEAVKRQNHPTADEIYVKLRKRMPQLSLGTVYRNLDEMAAAGMIRNLSLGNRQARFDHETGEHFHIRCIKCGMVKNIKIKQLSDTEEIFRKIAGKYGFKGYRCEFLHMCKKCSEEAETKNAQAAASTKKVLTMFD